MTPLKRRVKAVTVSLRLEEDDLKQLDLIAKDSGVTRPDVIRAAIQLFFSEHRPQNADGKDKSA